MNFANMTKAVLNLTEICASQAVLNRNCLRKHKHLQGFEFSDGCMNVNGGFARVFE